MNSAGPFAGRLASPIFLIVHRRFRIAALATLATLGAAAPRPARALEAPEVEPAAGAIPDLTRAPLEVLPPVRDGQRASGVVFIGYRGSDGRTAGGIATLAPWWASFVRVGAEVTPGARSGDVRLMWGVGLERWRDATFFLHVQDWGLRADRLTLRTAEASVGYKLPAPCGGPFCLATAAFATVPFSGGPFVGGRVTVTVGRTWFVTSAFGWTIPGALPGSANAEPWRLTFALGRADGRPGGIFLAYRDDVNIDRPGDWAPANRQGKGVVAAGLSWAY